MRRREFIGGLAGAAVSPFAARAQQLIGPVIGCLNNLSVDADQQLLAAFHDGLNSQGYAEGRNIAIVYRWADSHNDRLPELAADLISQKVAVIAALGTPTALAAKAATASIPIVFLTGGDPVALGLVPRLNRPGGNVTGVTLFNIEVMAKLIEIMHELVPATTRVALLINPTNQKLAEEEATAVQIGARVLGLQLVVINASNTAEIAEAFSSLTEKGASALLLSGDALFIIYREQLFALAEKYRVPTIYAYREFVEAGGLMSYGSSIAENYRLVGVYTGRILNGDKPADLPVLQSTKIEFAINLKAAKLLDLAFPITLLGRADKVIE
jgi:putative tryptophan/tyrosine transport system substrate-binding protein